MSSAEMKDIKDEIAQIDATIGMLSERRYRLKKKMEEGVSTPSNARKGVISPEIAASVVADLRRKAYQQKSPR